MALNPGVSVSSTGECFFRSDVSASMSVELRVQMNDSVASARALYDTQRARLSGGPFTVENLSDLDDAAFLWHAPGVSAIYADDANTVFSIICSPSCTDDALRGEAELVTSRLR